MCCRDVERLCSDASNAEEAVVDDLCAVEGNDDDKRYPTSTRPWLITIVDVLTTWRLTLA